MNACIMCVPEEREGEGGATGEEKEDTYLQCVSVCTLSLVHDVATLFKLALCRFSKRSCCLKLNAAAVHFLWKLPTFFGNDKRTCSIFFFYCQNKGALPYGAFQLQLRLIKAPFKIRILACKRTSTLKLNMAVLFVERKLCMTLFVGLCLFFVSLKSGTIAIAQCLSVVRSLPWAKYHVLCCY